MQDGAGADAFAYVHAQLFPTRVCDLNADEWGWRKVEEGRGGGVGRDELCVLRRHGPTCERVRPSGTKRGGCRTGGVGGVRRGLTTFRVGVPPVGASWTSPRPAPRSDDGLPRP